MLRATIFSKGTIEMKPWMMAGSTALALLYSTGAVRAAVTPEDVWTNWKAMAEGFGETITATSEAREGNVLVVKGVTIAINQDGGTGSGMIDELRFADLGDGTVEVTMSDTMAMTMSTPSTTDGQPPVNMAMTWTAPGMVSIASGTPDAISYALDAPEIKVQMEGADATDATKSVMKLDMGLTGHIFVRQGRCRSEDGLSDRDQIGEHRGQREGFDRRNRCRSETVGCRYRGHVVGHVPRR